MSDTSDLIFSVPGFRAAGIRVGIKPKSAKRDLALIVSDVPTAVAGVFTKTTVPGAPVVVSRERVGVGCARGVVINSGCSNVATGVRGIRDAKKMAALAAKAVGCNPDAMLVASTGVIGVLLPMPTLERGIPLAARELASDGFAKVADAILTTDTVRKVAVRRIRIAGRDVTLGGVAKGSGMIEPNMATMLAFLVTDAAIAPNYLQRLLREAAAQSFNRVSVDGEGSTSDMALLFANGVAGNALIKSDRAPGAKAFAQALNSLTRELAQSIARDGEGATKLVTVQVTGAVSQGEAERAARRIANSLLVKTAVFGGDPNWGRILQTVGAEGLKLELSRAAVRIGGVAVFQTGRPCGPAAVKRAAEKLQEKEVLLAVHLGVGQGSAEVWTCDLSYDYVRINAEYTT